ncbi:hypothetical protein ACX0G7_27060 [Flavitalea antarctica]
MKTKGGIPVLVTSLQRRSFDSSGRIIGIPGVYPGANRRVAKEENVALIDLDTMSKSMYEAWGPEESNQSLCSLPGQHLSGTG